LFKYRIVSAGIRSSPSARKAAVIKRRMGRNFLGIIGVIYSHRYQHICDAIFCPACGLLKKIFIKLFDNEQKKKEFSCDCDISVRVAMFYNNIGWFFILLLGNFHEMVVKVYRMR